MNKAKRPEWLNKKISLKDCSHVKELLKDLRLHTVCEEALCPNMGECFGKRQATFIILGAICTRACRFCGVAKGNPLFPDTDEPKRIVEAVKRMGLRHVVITSVTRDDLPEGGAAAFAEIILRLRDELDGKVTVETLVPDFKSERGPLSILADARPDIFAHNIETVPGLYKELRPVAASYGTSLGVLRNFKEFSSGALIKSGLMVGLGEAKDEVLEVFKDLFDAGCRLLSIGQYLAPSLNHYPVKEYISPEQFDYYRKEAEGMGFYHVESGPYVRSSYKAEDYLNDGRLQGRVSGL
ncbi:MAG: lipoyl synthase [Candidatus Omnitrophica bacterium]|nr:lipoyl synthase [Candidatus Omnitrophota bacterium]MDD5771318.1 lipoyl synthase [Candidatus Omnitrophota bacterium]